jgi:glycosyltransferase involved in cell wall biosynthesis
VTRTVHVVLPGGVDDPATPSGGNRYDRRVCDGLRPECDVHEIAIPGAWPRPEPPARQSLARSLADLPDAATVLLDGLVAGGVPDVLEPEAKRLRLIVLVHLALGDETGLDPAEAAALSALERRTLHCADAIMATSGGAARRLVDRYDLDAARVHVAAPGVDPAPATVPSADGGRLLCVAAVTPRKGQDVLVEALAAVADLSWTCDFVGALDRAPGFVTRVRDRAATIRPAVRFVGTRSGVALDAAYAGADLLVLPSRAETYGMVVTEALARGVPVLGTAVDGVPEALGTAPDGVRPGMLVSPGDAGALATALRTWLTDPGLRARWRAAAHGRRTTLRGWDVTARKVSEVLALATAEQEHRREDDAG